MRGYRKAQRQTAIFLAAYFLGGLLSLLHPRGEVFPVYSWFLFPLVPAERTQFALRLYSAGGEPLPLPRSITVHELAQQLGAAVDSADSQQVQRVRRTLERNFLPPGARYELVRESFEPLTRWKTGQARVHRLATFSTQEPTR
jgi:hypothetical protein